MSCRWQNSARSRDRAAVVVVAIALQMLIVVRGARTMREMCGGVHSSRIQSNSLHVPFGVVRTTFDSRARHGARMCGRVGLAENPPLPSLRRCCRHHRCRPHDIGFSGRPRCSHVRPCWSCRESPSSVGWGSPDTDARPVLIAMSSAKWFQHHSQLPGRWWCRIAFSMFPDTAAPLRPIAALFSLCRECRHVP